MSRPRCCPDDTLLLVVLMRRQGCTVRAIADALNGARVPTPAGRARWWPSYVTRLLHRADGRRLLAADDPAAALAEMGPRSRRARPRRTG